MSLISIKITNKLLNNFCLTLYVHKGNFSTLYHEVPKKRGL
jgi:hypothetical protein